METLSSSCISADTWFDSIVPILLSWEFVTALCSSWIILVSRWESNLLHCCNYEQTLSYFNKNSLKFSNKSVNIAFMFLTKFELMQEKIRKKTIQVTWIFQHFSRKQIKAHFTISNPQKLAEKCWTDVFLSFAMVIT